jgi:hypothetical protein
MFLDPDVLPYFLFLNALNVCCSLRMKDQVSRPYKTNGKIRTYFSDKSIIFFRLPFLDTRRQDKRFWSDSMNLIYPQFPRECKIDLFSFLVPRYFNFTAFRAVYYASLCYGLSTILVTRHERGLSFHNKEVFSGDQPDLFLMRQHETSFHTDTTDCQRRLPCLQSPSELQILTLSHHAMISTPWLLSSWLDRSG